MKSIFHYCQGESHKSSDKPCQDCAYAESTPDLSMAIVCDGHGGERYFRSQIGSQLAVEVTKKAIKGFLLQLEDSSYARNKRTRLFSGEKFTEYSDEISTQEQTDKEEHHALMWLFSSIINEWNKEIAVHALNNDLTEWEQNHVEQQYIDEFLAKRQDAEATFEKTYGCTLMVYVQTKDFWFAFHIGDGKFVRFDDDDGSLVCSQPIPWDERCFLNKTTSLCDSNAIERFRYCYQGDGHFPIAVFLGSDGLDDSYGDGEHLYNFYIEIFKLLLRKGNKSTEQALKRDLPKISKIGSKDDMSVASVYNDSEPIGTFLMLSRFQEEQLMEKAQMLDQKIADLQQKIEDYGDPEKLVKADLINRQYAQNDLQRAVKKLENNKNKIKAIRSERTKFKNTNGVNDDPVQDEDEISLPSDFDSETNVAEQE